LLEIEGNGKGVDMIVDDDNDDTMMTMVMTEGFETRGTTILQSIL
jgi:hypothetical protein